MEKKKKKQPLTTNKQLIERLEALQEISVELINTRDPHHLLSLIVYKAIDLLESDAGSLYLKGEKEELIFEVSKNKSVSFDFEKKIIQLADRTLATYCFKTGNALRIKDVREVPASAPYQFNPLIDQKVGYRTRSIITYPLSNSKNEVLGVIQIINRKNSKDELWPSKDESKIAEMPEFNEEDEKLLKSFASLASTAIENSHLYKNINGLLEGFVHASVRAIEARDMATSGHSERVALLTSTLAETASTIKTGYFKNINFSEQQIREIRYASLLHDFGKIGVKEKVLLKSEKLYPHQKVRLEMRLRDFAHSGEIHILRSILKKLHAEKRAPHDLEMMKIEKEIKEFRNVIEEYWKKIIHLNETTVLDKDNSNVLSEIKNIHLHNLHGHKEPLLCEDEIKFLSIKRGSLSDIERDEINSHVTMTYQFLKEIPWTKEFSSLLDIAYTHHEKLDGTGYPRGLKENEIPVQAQIMCICDIYDALVANDRPYKKAVPIARALEILEMECKSGKLQPDFFKLFVEAKIFERPEFIKLMNGNPNKKVAA